MPDPTAPELFALYGDPLSADLTDHLDRSGIGWVAINNPDDPWPQEPESGFTGAIVSVVDNPESAWALCKVLRLRDIPIEPMLIVASESQLDRLDEHQGLFDDFILDPPRSRELETRIAHLVWRNGQGTNPDVLAFGPISLNTETYAASVGGRPLDLTYMEYELLKFLASSPGKVFSREVLLNHVWGYDYYGGARTVDVHIRRLRAKLGETHAGLITTVRSVGYKLGTPHRPDSAPSPR